VFHYFRSWSAANPRSVIVNKSPAHSHSTQVRVRQHNNASWISQCQRKLIRSHEILLPRRCCSGVCVFLPITSHSGLAFCSRNGRLPPILPRAATLSDNYQAISSYQSAGSNKIKDDLLDLGHMHQKPGCGSVLFRDTCYPYPD
jgi:hypothetical protein